MGLGAPKPARTVGLLESYSTSRHNLGFYRCVASTARYSVHSSMLDGKTFKSAVEQAIAQTILAHPVLQVGIVGEDTTKPYFVHLPKLHLSSLVRWQREAEDRSERDATLQRLLEVRHSSLWPNLHESPGYEFIILPQRVGKLADSVINLDIVFAFHHAYGDGSSGAILQQTLLEALNNPVPVPSFDPSTGILTISTTMSVPPPQDALIDFKISWSFLIKTLWSEFAPSFLKSTTREPAWAGRPITTRPETTRLRLISFAPPAASAIVKQCRASSATLTPLIHILILHSLVNRLPASELVDRSLTSTTPISLRRLLPPGGKQSFDPSRTMGVLLASEQHRFSSSIIRQITSSFDETLFWELTSSLSTELRNKVAFLPNDDSTALMTWVSDWNERWKKMLGREREHTWEVSNVGAANFGPAPGQEKRSWTVERLVFSQSGSVAGSAFSVSVAGVRDCELVITLSWQDTIVGDELLDGVASNLTEWLTYFARTGRVVCKG